jgi:hypothetical protein
MRNKLIALFGLSAALFVSSSPVLAHHSMSMYDLNRAIILKGKVTSFSWSNPHAQIHFDVQDDQGNVRSWIADCPAPHRLSKTGWSMDALKIEEQVTIIGNQAKDGSNVMRLNRVVLPDGQELNGYLR